MSNISKLCQVFPQSMGFWVLTFGFWGNFICKLNSKFSIQNLIQNSHYNWKLLNTREFLLKWVKKSRIVHCQKIPSKIQFLPDFFCSFWLIPNVKETICQLHEEVFPVWNPGTDGHYVQLVGMRLMRPDLHLWSNWTPLTRSLHSIWEIRKPAKFFLNSMTQNLSRSLFLYF